MGVQLVLAAAATPDTPPWNQRRHESPKRATDPRTTFDIDGDRIVHSSSFRELQYKTQVQGLLQMRWPRLFRTRLNHVLEVAQIAEGISRVVGANQPLAKAIALAHDLGHPPFGHAGERALRDELKARGREGWNANVHSLAVVDSVEEMFISFRGLDLTWATREGIARHSTPFDEPVTFGEFAATRNGGLECQVVDAADVFAYIAHDLDDALTGEYISFVDVRAVAPLLDELLDAAFHQWESGHAAWPEQERGALIRRWLIATLVHRLIRDVGDTTHRYMQSAQLETAEDVRNSATRTVRTSGDYGEAVAGLLRLLTARYYRSSDVAKTDEAAARLVRHLLEALLANDLEIPIRFRRGDDLLDAATYLASINDHTAVALAKNLGIEANAASTEAERVKAGQQAAD
jgi:dGTPase